MLNVEAVITGIFAHYELDTIIQLDRIRRMCELFAGMEQLDTKGQYPETGMILRVRQITYQAVKINAYELTDPGGEALPPFTAGAHIDFHFRDGSVRQYSLCNDPAERHRYLIAILREEHGRGGSQALHERLHVQRMVSIGRPRNNFPLAENATRSLLLAGGIGITPIMSMTYELQRARQRVCPSLLHQESGPQRLLERAVAAGA